MKKILKYIFSTFLLFLITTSSYSQSARTRGLRLGVDLSRFAYYLLEPGRECFEVSADFEVLHNLYTTIEYGQESILLDEAAYQYESTGSYYRLGADYNFLKVKPHNQHDMLFAGIRYGSAKMVHSSENITVRSGYWGDFTNGSIERNNINAYWMEVVAGIKAELLKNFFMGWSFSGRVMLTKTSDEYMNPYHVAGFGRGSKNATIGFNYSIYYKIPLFKEKTKPGKNNHEE